MRHYLRNTIDYTREFGIWPMCSLIWQRKRGCPILELRPAGIRYHVKIRASGSDFAVLRQVIGHQEVYFEVNPAPKTIIDAGANIGLASVAFANLWPDAKILAIEPDRQNFDLLVKNTEAYPNVHCVNGALMNSDGVVEILNPEADAFSFQVRKVVNDQGEKPIRAFSMQSLMSELDTVELDLLKVDIEGGEYDLFDRSSLEWIPSVQTIAVEPHERYVKGVTKRLHTACAGRDVSTRGEYLIFNRRRQI